MHPELNRDLSHLSVYLAAENLWQKLQDTTPGPEWPVDMATVTLPDNLAMTLLRKAVYDGFSLNHPAAPTLEELLALLDPEILGPHSCFVVQPHPDAITVSFHGPNDSGADREKYEYLRRGSELRFRIAPGRISINLNLMPVGTMTVRESSFDPFLARLPDSDRVIITGNILNRLINITDSKQK